jgi:hypothetical protein
MIFSGSAGSMTQNLVTSRPRTKAPAPPGSPGSIFDADGLPTRLPQTPQEALQFQFAAADWARKKNESMLNNAQATMRYGLGMINKFGPYSAATMMNPLLGQMSQNYMNMQYDQPDYSAFMRMGAGGGAGGGVNPGSPPTSWVYDKVGQVPGVPAPAPQGGFNVPDDPGLVMTQGNGGWPGMPAWGGNQDPNAFIAGMMSPAAPTQFEQSYF